MKKRKATIVIILEICWLLVASSVWTTTANNGALFLASRTSAPRDDELARQQQLSTTAAATETRYHQLSFLFFDARRRRRHRREEPPAVLVGRRRWWRRHLHAEVHSAAALSIPRGGGSAAANLKKFRLSVEQTAVACCIFLAFNGLSIVLAPNLVMKDLYKIDYQANVFSSYLLRALGCLSIGTSIHVAATLLLNQPVTQAMGWSLLPRVLFWIGSFVFGINAKVGIQNTRLLVTTAVATTWSCLSLLTGLGRPIVSARIFAILALAKSALFVTRHDLGAQKFFGIDVRTPEMKRARALCRGLGNELATSAVLMWLSTTANVPFARAAGYTCLLWIVLLGDMAFVDKTWRLMFAYGFLQ